ncbi:hypothetical protein ABIC09_002571 [Bradyrhizobium sp. S3.12.5]
MVGTALCALAHPTTPLSPRLHDDLGVRLGIGEIGERLGDAVDGYPAVTIAAASTCPSAIRRSDPENSSGV